MFIRFTHSVPLKSIHEFSRVLKKLRPLPNYIKRRGPYIDDVGSTRNQIVLVYEFEKPKLAEAWKYIFLQWDAFRCIPGSALSGHVFEEGKELQSRLSF